MPDDDAGWAHIPLPRIIGLSMLNTTGMETVRFNMPDVYRDGSETLSCSWRLKNNFALNRNYAPDIAGVPDTALIMIGTEDEALKTEAFAATGRALRSSGYMVSIILALCSTRAP